MGGGNTISCILIVEILVLLALIGYFVLIRTRIRAIGNPERQVNMPSDSLSPAGVAFVLKHTSVHERLDIQLVPSDPIMTAALVDMAAKGCIKITLDQGRLDRHYTITQLSKGSESLAPEEQKLASYLFDGSDCISVTNKSHKVLVRARSALIGSLKEQYCGKYFVSHPGYFVVGLAFSVLALVCISFASAKQGFEILGIIRFVPPMLLAYIAAILWHEGIRGVRSMGLSVSTRMALKDAVTFSGLALFFAYVCTRILDATLSVAAVVGGAILVAYFVVDAVFYSLLESPTPDGLLLMEKITGLHARYSLACSAQLRCVDPFEDDSDCFTVDQAYAVALGSPPIWASVLSRAISAAQLPPVVAGGP